jgi:hypothetical protein
MTALALASVLTVAILLTYLLRLFSSVNVKRAYQSPLLF